MKKIFLSFLLFVLPFLLMAQEAPVWKLGFNPFSLAEPQPSIGLCAEYRISGRWGLFAESSFILGTLYLKHNWRKLGGLRILIQPRYYTGNDQTIFLATEFRLKYMAYQSSGTFINGNDTLNNFSYSASQLLLGGAFMIGKQIKIERFRRLSLEITAGIGARQRNIHRHNIPAGYEYLLQKPAFGLAPHYEWDKDGTAYIPLGLRLMWRIN